jgi:hypothetical protein
MSSTSESSKIAEVDKEAFQAVREALEVAPVVWDQIEEALGDNSANRDTQQILENARFVTRRLSDDVHAISGDNSESDKKAVGDSAHLFLKVRELSKLSRHQGSMILLLDFCPSVKHSQVKCGLWFYIDCSTIKYGKTHQLD